MLPWVLAVFQGGHRHLGFCDNDWRHGFGGLTVDRTALGSVLLTPLGLSVTACVALDVWVGVCGLGAASSAIFGLRGLNCILPIGLLPHFLVTVCNSGGVALEAGVARDGHGGAWLGRGCREAQSACSVLLRVGHLHALSQSFVT